MSFELSRKRVIVGCHHHPTIRLCEECTQLQERLIAQGDPKGHAVASQLWLWWPWRAWKSSRAGVWGVGQLSGAEGANLWGTQRLLWGACEWPEGSYVLCLQGSICPYFKQIFNDKLILAANIWFLNFLWLFVILCIAQYLWVIIWQMRAIVTAKVVHFVTSGHINCHEISNKTEHRIYFPENQ